MREIRRYSGKILRGKETITLGKIFVDAYINKKKFPGKISQLELITKVFSRRDINKKYPIYRHIMNALKSSVREERYEDAAIFRDMRDYFFRYIFD